MLGMRHEHELDVYLDILYKAQALLCASRFLHMQDEEMNIISCRALQVVAVCLFSHGADEINSSKTKGLKII